MSALPADLLTGFLDDAAIFPPGNAPVPVAVVDHAAHLHRPYAALLGPLVVRASDLAGVGDVAVSVTTGLDGAHAAVVAAGPRLRMLEVALPDTAAPDEVRSLASLGVDVVVEVPRDERRDLVLAELALAGLGAKFRTGGPRADLHPSEAELAAGIHSAVALGVSFKATAGLHHAVRRTAPGTGFEEHGFLNLLLATAAAQSGASVGEVERLLAERDPETMTRAALGLTPDVRRSFRSIGTCSIIEPLADLDALGLLPSSWKEPVA